MPAQSGGTLGTWLCSLRTWKYNANPALVWARSGPQCLCLYSTLHSFLSLNGRDKQQWTISAWDKDEEAWAAHKYTGLACRLGNWLLWVHRSSTHGCL